MSIDDGISLGRILNLIKGILVFFVGKRRMMLIILYYGYFY